MRGYGCGTRTSIGATPGEWLSLRTCLILVLGAGILCGPALAAPAAKANSSAKAVAAQTRDTNPADFVGAAVCASCHEAEAEISDDS